MAAQLLTVALSNGRLMLVGSDGQPREAFALSIQQPWAWLIVNGVKDIENRSWRTARRGPILIHTGMTIDRDAHQAVARGYHPVTGKRTLIGNRYPASNYEPVPIGGIVGVAEIVDCVGESPSPWFVGDYGLVLRNAAPVPFMRCKGALGFFRPNVVEDAAHVQG
ncbi:MAG: hypothetical protein JWP92_3701 [Caulobacter sp.]|nr:hypothetical protein [Caulobacter sp.]